MPHTVRLVFHKDMNKVTICFFFFSFLYVNQPPNVFFFSTCLLLGPGVNSADLRAEISNLSPNPLYRCQKKDHMYLSKYTLESTSSLYIPYVCSLILWFPLSASLTWVSFCANVIM